MSKKKLCILTIAFSSLTLLMSFPAHSQPSNKSVLSMLEANCAGYNTKSQADRCYKRGIRAALSVFSMLEAGCAAHNTESEAYRCYDKGIKATLGAKNIPAIMRAMCNVTQGKAEQEVYCYRGAVKKTEYKILESTIINACGRNTNWGSELACIVGAVESAIRR